MLFATVSVVGGILLALGSTVPISPYVTTIAFLFYVGCRLVGARRDVRLVQDEPGSRSIRSTP